MGISTMKEREYTHPEKKIAVKFNYWDYIKSFNKALLYENANKKHSWFIKICSHVFKQHIPNRNAINVIFFVEFSIPWIMKWTIEVQMNEEGFPCLKRKFRTKFWSKLLQRDAEGKDQSKVAQGRDDISPFKQITRKLEMKKGAISKSELLASYMEEVKKDLIKNIGIEYSDNISMATSNEKEDTSIAGESQSVHSTEEMDIETFLQQFKNQIEESSSSDELRGKETRKD
ncbi:hypothetical protein H5410_050634 [Solanum commersonii]|uniref:Uncharacterized protein n=1 Tax=Solanum commersonii TaxID=4109 RepID=A0A9J5WXB9_SOLCO|nr:hypothetical protein H5410_050634 [Solanum commersonii]